VGRVLAVHREPMPDAAAPYGWRYGARQVLESGASVAPLAAPDARVLVADLLP
jgi:hypothetical protein